MSQVIETLSEKTHSGPEQWRERGELMEYSVTHYLLLMKALSKRLPTKSLSNQPFFYSTASPLPAGIGSQCGTYWQKTTG